MRKSIKIDTPARKNAYADVTAYEQQAILCKQRFAYTVYGKILKLILQKPMTAEEISRAVNGDATPQQISAWLTKNTNARSCYRDPVFHRTVKAETLLQDLGMYQYTDKDRIRITYTKRYENIDYVKLDENGKPNWNKQLRKKVRVGGLWQAFVNTSR